MFNKTTLFINKAIFITKQITGRKTLPNETQKKEK